MKGTILFLKEENSENNVTKFSKNLSHQYHCANFNHTLHKASLGFKFFLNEGPALSQRDKIRR